MVIDGWSESRIIETSDNQWLAEVLDDGETSGGLTWGIKKDPAKISFKHETVSICAIAIDNFYAVYKNLYFDWKKLLQCL